MSNERHHRVVGSAALLVFFACARAWANSAMPSLFGKEVVRALAWGMTPFAVIGLLVGVALGVVAFSPRFVAALDSSLLVFSRGVISIIALGTFVASAFCLTVALMVLIDSRVVGTLGAVYCFLLLPAVAAVLITVELAYAATLYARVHRSKKDGTSRFLSVTCKVLAVLSGLAALLAGTVGVLVILDSLAISAVAKSLTWGLGGVGLSALMGLTGLALALSGSVCSTGAVLGRGAVMLLSVGIFMVSAIGVNLGIEELSRASGAPAAGGGPNAFIAMALFAFVLLLIATEFAIGAALHFRVARVEGSSLGKWLGGTSGAIAGVFALGSLLVFGLATIGVLLGA